MVTMAASHDHRGPERAAPDWSRIVQALLWAGLAAAVVILVTRHRAHLGEILPLLLLLACPLLHFLGHGHGHADRAHGAGEDEHRHPR